MNTPQKHPTYRADEARARRRAARLGLRISKVYGQDAFFIVHGNGFAIAADPPVGMTLDEVLTFLEDEADPAGAA